MSVHPFITGRFILALAAIAVFLAAAAAGMFVGRVYAEPYYPNQRVNCSGSRCGSFCFWAICTLCSQRCGTCPVSGPSRCPQFGTG